MRSRSCARIRRRGWSPSPSEETISGYCRTFARRSSRCHRASSSSWNFLRDFRGDTVHPSTLEVMHELGVLDDFLKRPHQKQVRQIRARIGRDEIMLGDLSLLSTHCRFMVMMPQWEFLDFLAEQARRHPTFYLRMETEVTGLIEENGRIVGIRGNAPAGPVEVRVDLVVGADGRNSVVRDCSGLPVEDLGAPTD